MSANGTSVPDWDLEQLEVILEPPSGWQLVIAGPGAGKSAVACQRVAHLVDEGVPPSRILLVSFSRTAVAELRNRIISYAVAGAAARSVRISTIDSHAWSLRVGFDDSPLSSSFGKGSFDLSIEHTVKLFKSQNPEIIDFLSRLEHLFIDEAQDVMGLRADLVLQMLKHLSPTCGVTILADPAQAIYGFTTDNSDPNKNEKSLLERLASESPRPLTDRTLNNIHRVKDAALAKLFIRTRKELEVAEKAPGYVARVQQTIRESSGKEIGATSFQQLADYLKQPGEGSMLVLFRRRADVLMASSYCSVGGVEHRLRMSDLPIIVRPWLGWLLGETVQAILSRDDFERLWEMRNSVCAVPFQGEQRDECWAVLHRLAASTRTRSIDLVHLRNVVARSRPPIELCYPEVGETGPILGTIHASKGREADSVFLLMSPHKEKGGPSEEGADKSAMFEEGRVYYVGATRARKMLVTAGNSTAPVGYLDSGRVFREFMGENRAQLEVGRDGDVDKLAHLAWTSSAKAQRTLAAYVGKSVPVRAWTIRDENFALRLVVDHTGENGVSRGIEIGQLSSGFSADLKQLWGKVDKKRVLRPPEIIQHLYLVAVGTVGLSEFERGAVRAPYNQSAFAITPIIKGFPMIPFFNRRGGG